MDPQTGKINMPKSDSELTESERIQYEWNSKFRVKEYEIYKGFHRVVLDDDGISTLKKTAFKLPGYRKVLGNKMEEYEINNNFSDQKQKDEGPALGSNLFVPEELVDSDGSHTPDQED